MSNCDFVAGRSLIDLVASRLALRAAMALTQPNQSAQWLPCGRHTVPTGKTSPKMRAKSLASKKPFPDGIGTANGDRFDFPTVPRLPGHVGHPGESGLVIPPYAALRAIG